MNSPEHRANILDTSYVDVGFGFANSPNFVGTGPETVVVAEYAEPSSPAPQPVATTTLPQTTARPTPTPAPTTSSANPSPTTSTTPSTPSTQPTTQKQSTAIAVTTPATTKIGPQPEPPSKTVARIQLVTNGSAPWSLFVVSSIASIGLCVFVLRYAFRWKKILVKSEAFVAKHPFLDIVLVLVITAGFVLTRSAGVIR